MQVVLHRFKIGPVMKFNGGNPIALRGTNILAIFHPDGSQTRIDLGDDQWRVEADLRAEIKSWQLVTKIQARKLKCTTCGESYSKPPTFRASVCSNGFHCCRDCTWHAGHRIQKCEFHRED